MSIPPPLTLPSSRVLMCWKKLSRNPLKRKQHVFRHIFNVSNKKNKPWSPKIQVPLPWRSKRYQPLPPSRISGSLDVNPGTSLTLWKGCMTLSLLIYRFCKWYNHHKLSIYYMIRSRFDECSIHFGLKFIYKDLEIAI